jgi:hypothetical protein
MAHLHIFVNGRKFGPDDGVREVMTAGEIARLVGIPIGLAVVRLDPRIDPKDLRIDIRPSPTSGGANTNCAVRITHLPSTLVAVSDNKISQIRNRAKAMQLLLIELYESGHVQPRNIATYEQIRSNRATLLHTNRSDRNRRPLFCKLPLVIRLQPGPSLRTSVRPEPAISRNLYPV